MKEVLKTNCKYLKTFGVPNICRPNTLKFSGKMKQIYHNFNTEIMKNTEIIKNTEIMNNSNMYIILKSHNNSNSQISFPDLSKFGYVLWRNIKKSILLYLFLDQSYLVYLPNSNLTWFI